MSRSTSQLGELPQVDQNMVNSGNQSFQEASGGMARVVGRNRAKYLVAVEILLHTGTLTIEIPN